MLRLDKVVHRNRVTPEYKRYTLSKLISESYQLLYKCPVDSKMYRLIESHISNIADEPSEIEVLSRNLSALKELVSLKENARVRESDIEDEYDPDMEEELGEDSSMDYEDEAPLDEEEDAVDDDEIPLEEDEDEDDDEIPLEEDEDEDDDEIPLEEDEDIDVDDEDLEESEEEDEIPLDEEEEENTDITPEELDELKNHLKQIRRQSRMKRESEEEDEEEEPLTEGEEEEECDGEDCEEGCKMKESSWSRDGKSMKNALRRFRESSKKKAFLKTFSKLQKRLSGKSPLTLDESIVLYKAANSAMTHLTVELEHNPEFIFTFRECTKILSKDNDRLLSCIRENRAPSKKLVESFNNFSKIILESEELDDEITNEDEEFITPNVEGSEPTNDIDESEEEMTPEEDAMDESEDVAGSIDEETPGSIDEETPGTLNEEEDADDMDDEITDEEAAELKKKLSEMRSKRRKK